MRMSPIEMIFLGSNMPPDTKKAMRRPFWGSTIGSPSSPNLPVPADTTGERKSFVASINIIPQ